MKFNTLAEALKRAGYKPTQAADTPAGRLETLMAQAIATGAGMQDASVEEFIKRLTEAADWELVWALCEEVRRPAARRLFDRVLWQIKQQNRRLFPSEEVTARPTPPASYRPGTTDIRGPSTQLAERLARSSTVAATGRALAEQAARKERLSWLDKFMVNGRPVGDIDPREASLFSHLRAREVRFIELLLMRMTPGSPLTIRECVDDDEADRLWVQADEETRKDAA